VPDRLPEILRNTKDRHHLFGSPPFRAVVYIEGLLLKGARDYFDDMEFKEIVVPHITKATGACENIDTLFGVDYFGEKGYLSQTAQLYLESLIPWMNKVWCISPSFRAEPRVDSRHLTEFTLIELEFAGTFEELLEHIEGVLISMINAVLKKMTSRWLDRNRLRQITAPFPRISYTEAIAMLDREFGHDISREEEQVLVEKFGGKPLFITHYPKMLKFFNMIEDEENPRLVDSADLILPFGGEAVGAASREYRADRLYKRLEESQMLKQLVVRGGSISDFEWYIDVYRKYETVPHAGCGIGLNRVTQFVLGVNDIRMCTAYPLNRETLI
jgi:asparaginyl-tRNA synthetase